MRALIIDDSRTMRIIISKIVREIGFETGDAGHGQEGLDWIAENGFPELVCCDWNMPEMNGLEFVQHARALPGNEGMQIMMITTESEADNVMAALEAGANEYLMKPFTKESIQEKLSILGLVP
ncbi:MAG: response regulator [Verrucomicrobia bacterium]|nr:response regulator [Verrucomicrobiota bacterium]